MVHAPIVRGLLAALISLAPAAALAQAREGFALDRFHAPPSVEDGLARALPGTLGHLRPSAALAVDYGYAPLVLAQGDDVAVVGHVVGHEAVGRLVGAFGILDRFQAEVEVPVTVFQSGDDPAVRGATFEAPEAFGAGDPAIGGSALLFGRAERGAQLGASLAVAIPVGSQDALAGDGGVGMRGHWLFAWLSPSFGLGANLGFAARPARRYDDVRTGSELLLDAGAYVPLGDLRLSAEIAGATLVSDAFSPRRTPLEALVGARWVHSTGIAVGAGAGPGIGHAVGVPTVRGLLTVGWAPPRPRETGPVRRSNEDEDLVGPAAGDTDGDGLDDDRDQCLRDPEPTNGVDDEDGCPDTVRVEPDRIRILFPVAFEPGTDALTAESIPVVEEIATVLASRPEIRVVRIQGHGDRQDGSRRDVALAERRARAVRDGLVELGVDSSRLRIRGERGAPRRGGGYVELTIVEGHPAEEGTP